MPVRIKKIDGYRVSHGGKVSAKRTTKEKAQAQANLLRGIEHGFKPTGKPARYKKGKGKSNPNGDFLEYVNSRKGKTRKAGG